MLVPGMLYVYASCWIWDQSAAGSVLRLLDKLDGVPPPFRQRCPPRIVCLGSIPLDTLHYTAVTTTPGRMQVDCGSWIPWLVSRIRSCADKLQGDRERHTKVDYSERPTKRYDDDGQGRGVGLRLLVLLDAVVMAARPFPPRTRRRRMAKKRGTDAAKVAALRHVKIRSSIVCFEPMNKCNV